MDIAKDIEMLVIGKKGSPLEIFIGVDVLELIKNKSFSFSNGVEFVQDLNDIELDHEGLRTLISENSGEKEFIKFSETFGEYDGEYGNDVSVHVFEKLSDLQDTLSYNYGLFIPSDIGKPEIAIGQVIAVRDPAENCVKYGTVGGIKFLSQTAKYSFWTSVHNGWLNIGENNFGNSYIDTLDKTEKEYFS